MVKYALHKYFAKHEVSLTKPFYCDHMSKIALINVKNFLLSGDDGGYASFSSETSTQRLTLR